MQTAPTGVGAAQEFVQTAAGATFASVAWFTARG